MTKENIKHKYVLINENFIEKSLANISISNRGFLFGDGIFESCRVQNQQIFNFDLHWKRLSAGAKYLQLNLPEKQKIYQLANQLINKNKVINGLIKIHVSRDGESMGYLPLEKNKINLFFQTRDLSAYPTNDKLIIGNVKASIYKFKTLNSLPYILAKIFANENNCLDSIMLDENNYICETSSANIFWIKDQKIYTPSSDLSIINGTIRQTLINMKELKIIEGKFKINDLETADEVFITNTNLLIFPISSIAFRNKKNFYIINYKKTLVKKVEKLLKIETKIS